MKNDFTQEEKTVYLDKCGNACPIRDKTSLLLAKNETYHILLKRYLGDKELAKAATEQLFKGVK